MKSGSLTPEQEYEMDRLLTAANVHRMRGHWAEAEAACRKAMSISPNNASVREMLGDVLYECGKTDAAQAEYRTLVDADRGNPSIEKKYAKTTLEIAERERQKAIAQDMLDNPGKYTARERKPGKALLLALLPGMGQFYNGEMFKAGMIWGTLLLFVMSWAIPHTYPPYVRTVSQFLQFTHPVVLVTGILAFMAYIYGLIDAPISASKSSQAPKDQIE